MLVCKTDGNELSRPRETEAENIVVLKARIILQITRKSLELGKSWELKAKEHKVCSQVHAVRSMQSMSCSYPHGLCSPWNSPGWNTGVGSHSLLQGIFPTQEWNWGLLPCRWILYQLNYKGRTGVVCWKQGHWLRLFPHLTLKSFSPRCWQPDWYYTDKRLVNFFLSIPVSQ